MRIKYFDVFKMCFIQFILFTLRKVWKLFFILFVWWDCFNIINNCNRSMHYWIVRFYSINIFYNIVNRFLDLFWKVLNHKTLKFYSILDIHIHSYPMICHWSMSKIYPSNQDLLYMPHPLQYLISHFLN